MRMNDTASSGDHFAASVAMRSPLADAARVIGRFTAVCRDAAGGVKWTEEFDNLITTVGKNFLLDTTLAGSSYTAASFLGLIGGASAPTILPADTMTTHSGWLESGTTNPPAMSSVRQTCAWSAASGGVKALSAGLTFTFTASGTIQGGFIVIGTGAVSTVLSTAGTLYSAGALGTPRAVLSTDTLTLTYSSTLT